MASFNKDIRDENYEAIIKRIEKFLSKSIFLNETTKFLNSVSGYYHSEGYLSEKQMKAVKRTIDK